jgi:hypothetical protein
MKYQGATMNKPTSAAVAARTLSRALGKRFERVADGGNEGFQVEKLGESNEVVISWTISKSNAYTDKDRKRVAEKQKEMREYLESRGVEFDPKRNAPHVGSLYVVCDRQ